MFAYSPLGSRLAVGAIEIVGAEPDGGGVDVGGGGGGGEGFLAATVAALPTMSATATIAAALTLRTRELVRLRIGRLPKCVRAPDERYVLGDRTGFRPRRRRPLGRRA